MPVTSALRTSPVPPSAMPAPSDPRPSRSAAVSSASATLPGRLSTCSPRVSCALIENHASRGASARNGSTTAATVGDRQTDAHDGFPATRAPPGVDHSEREEEQRIELDRDREPERDRRDPRAAVEQRREPDSRQGDGQRVEPGQCELAEEERRRRDEPQRRGGVPDASRRVRASESAVQTTVAASSSVISVANDRA